MRTEDAGEYFCLVNNKVFANTIIDGDIVNNKVFIDIDHDEDIDNIVNTQDKTTRDNFKKIFKKNHLFYQ